MSKTVGARIFTNLGSAEVLDTLAPHLQKAHATVERSGFSLVAMNPRAKFSDNTPAETRVLVTATQMPGGWVLSGTIDTKFKPRWDTVLILILVPVSLLLDKPWLFALCIVRLIFDGFRVSKRAETSMKMLAEFLEQVKSELSFPKAVAEVSVEMRKCPSCAEMVRAEAIRCRYCQLELTPVSTEGTSKLAV